MKTKAKRKKRPQLSREPQDCGKEAWYYEEAKGLYVVAYPEKTAGVTTFHPPGHALIPWKMLETTLRRYRAYKRARNSSDL